MILTDAKRKTNMDYDRKNTKLIGMKLNKNTDADILGYLEKQAQMIRQARQMEEIRLPRDICYAEISHLRLETRQKLDRQKPVSLGAAGRIPGVNPADVAVLQVWLHKRELETKNT